MALTRVPKDNVTLEQVQEVLKDFTNIPDITHSRNVDASLVFKSPNIEASFIDPDWCAGDTEEARKIELSVDNPISCNSDCYSHNSYSLSQIKNPNKTRFKIQKYIISMWK